MTEPLTTSEANRQVGKHQVDEQRAAILDTAEALFLEKGIANTSMVEIARVVGITKVTLYRYFANKDVIALEIQMQMLKKIGSVSDSIESSFTREELKRRVHVVIENFESLKDAFRYIGMFDQIYLDNPSDHVLAQWTKDQLVASGWRNVDREAAKANYPNRNERSVILSSLTWFLEKLALRGELTWSDAAIPIEEHLKIFEAMVLTYLDHFEQEK